MAVNQQKLPAPPKYPLGHHKYHLIETVRPIIQVYWGVLVLDEPAGKSGHGAGSLQSFQERRSLRRLQKIVFQLMHC